METEVWYELEVGDGSDDWYATNKHADTLEDISEKLREETAYFPGYRYRAIKKTLTTEVLP